MNDRIIISEAIRLVGEGVKVTLPVKGSSMLPFIIGGRESVILQEPVPPQRGQVVLAWVNGNRYVLHRIIHIEGDGITLMGDGNLSGTEHCTQADIKALATYVVDQKGKKHYLYSTWRNVAAMVWFRLRPVRRYPLALYRRVFIKTT